MKKTKIQRALTQNGVVSEIRVGVLVRSENKFLTYPCKVVVHVMERTTYGNINRCTVNTGEGAFVEAVKPEFMELTPILPFKYQHDHPKDILEKYEALDQYFIGAYNHIRNYFQDDYSKDQDPEIVEMRSKLHHVKEKYELSNLLYDYVANTFKTPSFSFSNFMEKFESIAGKYSDYLIK